MGYATALSDIDSESVEIGPSLMNPSLVRRYTRHAMRLTITIYGTPDTGFSSAGTVG